MDGSSVIGIEVVWRGWKWSIVKVGKNGSSYLSKILQSCEQMTNLDRQVHTELESKGWRPGFEFEIPGSVLAAIVRKSSSGLAKSIDDIAMTNQGRIGGKQKPLSSFWG